MRPWRAGRAHRAAMARRSSTGSRPAAGAASTGTSVRDSRYEASMANTTASASGVNRKRAGPASKTTGTTRCRWRGWPRWPAPPPRGRREDGPVSGLPMSEVAVDVLHLHGGVVDQHADGQRQPSEGHHVERLAGEAQSDDGREDGERDGGADDHHAAPAAQEQPDHQRHQQAAITPSAARRMAASHEDRLIGVDAQLDSLGRRGLDLRQQRPVPPR